MTEQELTDFYKQEVPRLNSKMRFIGIKELRNSKSSNVILIEHVDCGRIYPIIFANYCQRNYCRYCDSSSIDHRKFVDIFNKRSDASEYTILSEFKTTSDKIMLKHNVCGRILNIQASDLHFIE